MTLSQVYRKVHFLLHSKPVFALQYEANRQALIVSRETFSRRGQAYSKNLIFIFNHSLNKNSTT